jgi:hypothetical protein
MRENSALSGFPAHNGAAWEYRRRVEADDWPKNLAELAELLDDFQGRNKFPIRFLLMLHCTPRVTIEKVEAGVYYDRGGTGDLSHLLKVTREAILHWRVPYRIRVEGCEYIAEPTYG